jgi:serine/threonine protein phosphatase PrpC
MIIGNLLINYIGFLIFTKFSSNIKNCKLDNMVYAINVGDSRAVLSVNRGKETVALSEDHKPSNENEEKRIIANGGKIY